MLAQTQRLAGVRSRGWDDAHISRVAAGEHQAWRAFHTHYSPIATAFLRKLGVRQPDVDDACQEVFFQVHRYLPRFRGDALVKTWLFRLCITEARKVRRQRWAANQLFQGLVRSPPPPAVPAVTRSEAGLRALVAQALEQMSDGERAAFMLFDVQGLSGDEVAHITRCSPASVGRRLSSARRTLRRAMGFDEPGTRDRRRPGRRAAPARDRSAVTSSS